MGWMAGLRARFNVSRAPGGYRLDPEALRPPRLRWQGLRYFIGAPRATASGKSCRIAGAAKRYTSQLTKAGILSRRAAPAPPSPKSGLAGVSDETKLSSRTFLPCLRKDGARLHHPRLAESNRVSSTSHGPAINLVPISISAKSESSQRTSGLVGVNMPSGLSLNSQACRS